MVFLEPTEQSLIKTFLRTAVVLIILPILGTFGYWRIEGWSVFDSFYMSVITLSTVGFQEVHPLSDAGRLFTIVLLISGLGIFLYCVSLFGQIIVSEEFKKFFGGRRMMTTINKLEGHYIICGLGRMGEKLCDRLSKQEQPFVIIDQDPHHKAHCLEQGWLFLEGDVTEDEILEKAGVKRAEGIALALDKDSDNVFVCLSTRLMNPDITIVARASDDKNAQKMIKAGANHVVNIHDTAAHKMVHFLEYDHS